MNGVMAKFLDAIASLCADETRKATELQDSNRHYDAHEHACRAAALIDALTLGQEMQGREMDRQINAIREGATA